MRSEATADTVDGRLYIALRQAIRHAHEALKANRTGDAMMHLENALEWSPDLLPNGVSEEPK